MAVGPVSRPSSSFSPRSRTANRTRVFLYTLYSPPAPRNERRRAPISKEIGALRRSLRGAGGEYKVYKNTLVRFAVRDLGLNELEGLLTGPTAIAFVDGDAATVARALRDYAR